MSDVNLVLENYQKIAAYCDGFFNAVIKEYSNDIACCAGCSECCLLQSVSPVEAFVIARYLKSPSQKTVPPPAKKWDKCPFLKNERCTIYSVRPIICRTHGLLVTTPDTNTGKIYATCPRNFINTDYDNVPEERILDHETIAFNLMKLNLAFCMLAKKRDQAEVRISLYAAASNEFPSWFPL